MADQFQALTESHMAFIRAQKIFFVGSAARDGRVNVSPKGQDGLAVLGPSEILWLNLTGSGNETAAHLLEVNRLTLMWCAFEGPPLILRVYGSAVAVHPRDEDWQTCATDSAASRRCQAVFPGTSGSCADFLRLCRALFRLSGRPGCVDAVGREEGRGRSRRVLGGEKPAQPGRLPHRNPRLAGSPRRGRLDGVA